MPYLADISLILHFIHLATPPHPIPPVVVNSKLQLSQASNSSHNRLSKQPQPHLVGSNLSTNRRAVFINIIIGNTASNKKMFGPPFDAKMFVPPQCRNVCPPHLCVKNVCPPAVYENCLSPGGQTNCLSPGDKQNVTHASQT